MGQCYKKCSVLASIKVSGPKLVCRWGCGWQTIG